MTHVPSRSIYLLVALVSAGCTGLVAGPESQSATPVPASRDSAFVRARRALTGEQFTIDLADSTAGRFVATRWPGSNAKLGTATACHVRVEYQIRGDNTSAQVESTSRWLAPGYMSDKAPQVCEQERSQVLERAALVLNPPPPQ
jgi:hypothetical protein